MKITEVLWMKGFKPNVKQTELEKQKKLLQKLM